ncbi:MAG: DNA primase [Clostridiales bacterium]|nr:DNA primase [Clostridiales bacterium]
MPTFDEKFIEELKSKNNIVEVVSRYCNLVRKGSSNYWACCPLPGHTEKTPSFTVNEPGQFYHCFGCGKGGDVIKFIQEVETVDFFDAVKMLAERAKMPLPESDFESEEQAKKARNKKERLYSLMRESALFYAKNLSDERAGVWLEYLLKRGLDSKTVRHFGLGASLDYYGLVNHLKSKGYTEEEMLESGACAQGKKGVYDFQAERLIVPIISSMGKVIGFGGRILEDKGFGKYKNTSETTLFNKKNVLYNVNNLKKIRQETDLDYVIMVEGYMDAISLHSAGFTNVVASMGTSLTLSQAKLLKRYTNKVLVSYDGDGAGQKATIRSLDIFENEGFEVKVVKLPDGLDPDDVIRKYGAESYSSLLSKAEPLIDFKLSLIKKGKDLSDASDKRKYLSECLELLKTVKSEFLREELLIKVSTISGISYQSLKRDLESGSVTIPKNESAEKIEVKQTIKTDGLSVAERAVLWAVINSAPYADKNLILDLYFSDPVREKIFESITISEIESSKLYSIVGEIGLQELNAILSVGDKIDGEEQGKKYFNDCVKVVKKSNLSEDLVSLNKLYKDEIDQTKKAELAKLIAQKTIEISKL